MYKIKKLSLLIKLWHLKVCCIWVHQRFQWELQLTLWWYDASSRVWYLTLAWADSVSGCLLKIQFITNNSHHCLSPNRSAHWWGYETNVIGLKSLQGQEIQLVSKMSRLALRHIQPPTQWVLWPPSLTVKWSGCEINHSSP